MEQIGNLQVLKVQAPLAEVSDYGSTLKAITQGAGDYSMQLSHYDPLPGNLIAGVIAKAKAAAEAGEAK
jgi:elongation factor G